MSQLHRSAFCRHQGTLSHVVVLSKKDEATTSCMKRPKRRRMVAAAASASAAPTRVAVLGAGVIGLTSALRLLEEVPGLDSVTVIAEKWGRETTSDGAGGERWLGAAPCRTRHCRPCLPQALLQQTRAPH